MNTEIKQKTIYLDILDNGFATAQEARDSNHRIHLRFRKYIEKNLFRTFEDGRLDKLQTTLVMWENLEFTKEYISKINNIMQSKEK